MSSYATARPELLDEYPSHVKASEAESAWASRQLSELVASGERQTVETVSAKRHGLRFYATDGWRLEPLGELNGPRAFANRRPSKLLHGDAANQIADMTPAEFLRSFFEQGIVWEAAPDQDIWNGVLRFAETYLTPSDALAAREWGRFTAQALLVRAGAEPIGGLV